MEPILDFTNKNSYDGSCGLYISSAKPSFILHSKNFRLSFFPQKFILTSNFLICVDFVNILLFVSILYMNHQ